MSLLMNVARELRKRVGAWAARIAGREPVGPEFASLDALWQACRSAIEAGDVVRAESALRRILGVAPDLDSALSDLGLVLLQQGRVDESAACFRRLEHRRAGPGTITTALQKRHLDPDRARSGTPYFVRLSDVLVDTAYWSIMKDGVVYSDDTHGRNLFNSPWVNGRVAPDGATVIASYPAPRVTVAEECLFVGGDENFSHWLFRNLPKLCSVARDGLLERLPWLLNEDLKPYQEEYLDLLGVPRENRFLVARGQVIAAARLVVPALLTNLHTLPHGIAWLRDRLSSQMAPPAAATRLVYVSRRDAPQRLLLNEEALFAALAPLGFELFVPGQASVSEQIRVFSGARVIVGVHGAALANLVFAQPTAHIVEITNSAMHDMDDFRRIAASSGQRIDTIVCDRYAPGATRVHVNSDYYVDVEAVLRKVESAPG